MAVESTEPAIEGDAVYEQTWPDGRSLPLNSRRLDPGHLQQLAGYLELPINASMEETHQIIDGKLTEIGKEPPNVQVIFQETLYIEVILHLVDSKGVIGRSAPATRERIFTADRNEAARLRDTQMQLEDVLQALQDTQRTSQTLEEQLTAATQRAEVVEARLIDDTSSAPAEVTRLKATL